MTALIAITFLVILSALMFSISYGLRYLEAKRKKKLVSLLCTVTEAADEPQVDLLMEPESQKKESAKDGMVAIQNQLNTLVVESGLNWAPGKLFVAMAAGFGIGLVVGAVIPIDVPVVLKSLGTGLIGGFLPLMFVRKKRTARIDAMEAQMPDALDFLARSMRAGHAFTISLEMVGEEIHEPLGAEFRTLFNEQNLGAPLDRCLTNFAKRVPLSDVKFFASTVLLQRQTGGNLSEVLTRLSYIIRERFRLKGQVKAVSAHGRLTATILTLLPCATLGGLMLCSPGYLSPLFHSTTGRKLLFGGIGCLFLGNMFIRKIVRIKV